MENISLPSGSCRLPINPSGFVIVDSEDYPSLSQRRWYLAPSGYAVRSSKKQGVTSCVYMHRFILGAQKGEQVDHINGNKLDNRRSNLRLCSTSQNHGNMPKNRRNPTSVYKGVKRDPRRKKKPWSAAVTFQNRYIFLGTFATEEAAARAYDAASVIYFGEFAYCNFR